MKNIELYTITNQLQDLKNSKQSLPVSIGFKIRKNIKIAENTTTAYLEMRNAIIEKYGEQNEKTGNYEMSTDCVEGVKELQELDNIEVTLDDIEKVALADIEKLELPLNTLDAIEFMLGE